MVRQDMTAAAASHGVGYESPSQFNREFKRLFGLPPAEEIRRMQKSFALPPAQAASDYSETQPQRSAYTGDKCYAGRAKNNVHKSFL